MFAKEVEGVTSEASRTSYRKYNYLQTFLTQVVLTIEQWTMNNTRWICASIWTEELAQKHRFVTRISLDLG